MRFIEFTVLTMQEPGGDLSSKGRLFTINASSVSG